MLELAKECDWEGIRHLSVQIHDLHVAWRPDIYFHCEEPYPKEKFLEDVANRLVFVSKEKGEIAGYVVLSVLQKSGPGTNSQKLLRLDSICVDESYRGQGIGKAMIADVRALARAFGCLEVLLGVHPENYSALAFYQKCGFHIRTINLEINA